MPLAKNEASAPESISAGQVEGGSERVLLVDDDKQVFEMIKQMLEELGYQVTARISSIEALEVFSEHPEKFDLVIADQTMPNLTGSQLSRELLAIRPDIPIILCTGFSEVITEEKAKAEGIRAFVMKPIVRSKFARTIREVLDKGREE